METTQAKDIFNDEKIVTLICLGAATAANCIPCFEHLYEKAHQAGLTEKEIQGAAQLASIVKKGAHLAIKSSIDELLGTDFEAHDELPQQPCGCAGTDSAKSCIR
jgi:alkylhydroperoxidase/carboxymuconolactone decarboxylase family protein YurZ